MSSIFRHAGIVLPLAVASGVSALSFYRIYQHTFDAKNECIKMSYYGNLETPLDGNTQAVVDKVIDKLLFKATAKQMALTQFYWCNKPYVHYTGSTMSRFGTYIGIPIHYRYQNVSEVDLSDIQSSLNSPLEKSELLQRLRESLVLSENAKKFAISSEFFSADSYHLVAKGSNIIMIFGVYVTLQHILSGFLLKAPPPTVFFALIGVACVWTAVNFIVCGIYYTRLRASSDRKAALLGKDFLDGGLEYLRKVAERNVVLRELNPETEVFRIKPNGDEITSIFAFNELKTSGRLRQLEKLKENQEENNSSSEETTKS